MNRLRDGHNNDSRGSVYRGSHNTPYVRQSSPSPSSARYGTAVSPTSLGLREFLFRLNGRLAASTYVVSVVCMLIVFPLLFLVMMVFLAFLPTFIKIIATLAFVVLLLWTCIALMVRRLHDRGHSGWWVLIAFIPYLNAIFFLYLSFFKGEPRENRFGHPARPAPLLPSILCYAIYTTITLLSLMPNKSMITDVSKIPGLNQVIPSAEMEDADNLQQFIDAMPGVIRNHLNKKEIKESLALILLDGEMVTHGIFITENRILIKGADVASVLNNSLSQQPQVKSLAKTGYITRLVASSPEQQEYVFEVNQPLGKPGLLTEQHRVQLTAIGAFK